jgi:hypothetical protein
VGGLEDSDFRGEEEHKPDQVGFLFWQLQLQVGLLGSAASHACRVYIGQVK